MPRVSDDKATAKGCLVVLGICAVLGVLISMWGNSGSTPESDSDRAVGQSSLACDHFRNIMVDVQNGVLTDAEIRGKLQEVEDNASIATDEVQQAAIGMLAAITQGNTEGLTRAVGEMDAVLYVSG